MQERAQHVEGCIKFAQTIRESTGKLSWIQGKAIILAMGMNVNESDTDSETDNASEGVDVEDSHHPALDSVSVNQAQNDSYYCRNSLVQWILLTHGSSGMLLQGTFKISHELQLLLTNFLISGKQRLVSESNIGADTWRRTGVLTFDGNLRMKRIRQHLQD